MRRILIVGPGGAGKSTLAERMAARLALPLIHLDAEYWRPGWRAPSREVWAAQVEALSRGPAWIMDGNFGGTFPQRLAACDTVLLLDLPPWRCLWRVLRRRLRHRGETRPGMAPECPERVDVAFLYWIATWRVQRRPAMRRRLHEAAARGVDVHVLQSPRAVAVFLASLPPAR